MSGTAQAQIDKLATMLVTGVARRMAGLQPSMTAPSAKSGGPDASNLIGMFAGKLLAALVPISAVAAVIGAQTSGLSIFLSSIKVLGAVVGTLLAPGFILLSAAALTVADYLQATLLPNLETFYALIFQLAKDGLAAAEMHVLELAASAIAAVGGLDQFTHKKRTMAIADVLYGVTMQESGVSKQVAVRFEDWPEDEPQAANPAA